MRGRNCIVGTVCLLLPLMAACSQSSRTSMPGGSTAVASGHTADGQKNSRVLVGQLRSVDPNRKTLIMAFEDDLYEFAYTDATEGVGGASNVRAITGNTGNQIMVHYRQNPITSTKTAVRIEFQ